MFGTPGGVWLRPFFVLNYTFSFSLRKAVRETPSSVLLVIIHQDVLGVSLPRLIQRTNFLIEKLALLSNDTEDTGFQSETSERLSSATACMFNVTLEPGFISVCKVTLMTPVNFAVLSLGIVLLSAL